MTEPFEDSPKSRALLAVFLRRVFGPAGGAPSWEARFEHWWDTNPFAALVPERGWVLRKGEEAVPVGFLGVIPACYGAGGQTLPALVPTTWVVDPDFRDAALLLGRKLPAHEGRTLIVSTTPRRDFRDRLVRRGWVLNEAARRQFVPCGIPGRWVLGRQAPLAPGRIVTSDVDAVRSVVRSGQGGGRIEKWVTPEYLRWYRQSPARVHRFAGVVDAEGRLSSYLMLTPAPVLGILNVWSVVDWFACENDFSELHHLLAAVAMRPETADLAGPGRLRPWLLRLTAMNGDGVWSGVRGWFSAPVALNHFHRAPDGLRGLPKRCVLAEGDLGL